MSKMDVSVIMPAFNAEATVERAIASVIAQGDMVAEILLVDDGSDDRTIENAAKYGSTITILPQQNAGVSAARNHGVRTSSGQLVAFLDADDEWQPGKLAAQVPVFESRSDVGISITDFSEVNGDGTLTRGFDRYPVINTLLRQCDGAACIPGRGVFEALCHSSFVNTSTVVLRRSLFESIGPFNEDYAIAEDYDLWLRSVHASALSIVNADLVNKYEQSGSLCSDIERTVRFTEIMLGRLLDDLGNELTSSECRALRKKLSECQRSLGYFARKSGRRSEAYRLILASLKSSSSIKGLSELVKLVGGRK